MEEVKSMDDLNHQGRDSEVLLNVISKLETTTKQLAIAVECLGLIDKRKCHMANCLKNCPLKRYYKNNQGCATCLNNACHIALQQIKELEK